ncbi:MAG: hypothetical protein ABIJ50_10460 [Pseudomonadota bacterium]
MRIARQPFYDPRTICKEVKRKIEEVATTGEAMLVVGINDSREDINQVAVISSVRRRWY